MTSEERQRHYIMSAMSRREIAIAAAIAVLITCTLIVVRVMHGHGQPGTTSYNGKTYDCRTVLDSLESSQGPGAYPQQVLDFCVSAAERQPANP
jgi:hypothetical protein